MGILRLIALTAIDRLTELASSLRFHSAEMKIGINYSVIENQKKMTLTHSETCILKLLLMAMLNERKIKFVIITK